MQKIEFVLFELVVSACSRSPVNSRIDIWCRTLDDHWLEISITDSGPIDSDIIKAFDEESQLDKPVHPSPIPSSGLHFSICKSIMKLLGGEFSLNKLEDQRILSRVILPLLRNKPPV